MQEQIFNIGDRRCHILTSTDKADIVIVKPLGEFERRLLHDECEMIAERAKLPFVMLAFEVVEGDLRPQGAEATYAYLADVIMPYVHNALKPSIIILGGYSLGGLFALWASTRLEGLDAVYAGSPSLWMDGWDEYSDAHPLKVRCVSMSLGDKEECTNKKPFCIIGDRVRRQHERNVSQLGADACILQWNKGGHFNDIEQRKADGFAWCINASTTVK